MKPLRGFKVINLSLNLPGPLAGRHLHTLGAEVTKVEPPAGDPLQQHRPDWYAELNRGSNVLRLNLKDTSDQRTFNDLLHHTDLLLTSFRPAALAKLHLSWEEVHQDFPRICSVAIVGALPPNENVPGHDLTYQAQAGLIQPPNLPVSLFVDLAGAERAASSALALLLQRERNGMSDCVFVSLLDIAKELANPRLQGVTVTGDLLGGGIPRYGIYETKNGWVALAALEEHFWQKLLHLFHLKSATHDDLQRIFLSSTADEWDAFGAENGIPLVAVKD